MSLLSYVAPIWVVERWMEVEHALLFILRSALGSLGTYFASPLKHLGRITATMPSPSRSTGCWPWIRIVSTVGVVFRISFDTNVLWSHFLNIVVSLCFLVCVSSSPLGLPLVVVLKGLNFLHFWRWAEPSPPVESAMHPLIQSRATIICLSSASTKQSFQRSLLFFPRSKCQLHHLGTEKLIYSG